jgi:hypothetical protein
MRPDHGKPGDDDRGACRALRRQLFLEHQRCQREPTERGAGGLDYPAMGKRHEQEAGIAQERERRPAEQRQRHCLRPAHSPEIAETLPGDERQEDEPCPDEAVEDDVRRRKPDRDAVAGRDEPGRPEQGSAGAAGDAGGRCPQVWVRSGRIGFQAALRRWQARKARRR